MVWLPIWTLCIKLSWLQSTGCQLSHQASEVCLRSWCTVRLRTDDEGTCPERCKCQLFQVWNIRQIIKIIAFSILHSWTNSLPYPSPYRPFIPFHARCPSQIHPFSSLSKPSAPLSCSLRPSFPFPFFTSTYLPLEQSLGYNHGKILKFTQLIGTFYSFLRPHEINKCYRISQRILCTLMLGIMKCKLSGLNRPKVLQLKSRHGLWNALANGEICNIWHPGMKDNGTCFWHILGNLSC